MPMASAQRGIVESVEHERRVVELREMHVRRAPVRIERDARLRDREHGRRIERVLHAQHARRERLRRVAREHGHRPLRDDRAVIVALVHEVHRRAGDARAGGDHRRVHARAVHPASAEAGRSAGCTFTIRPRYAFTTTSGTSRMYPASTTSSMR